ncbi:MULTISPECIES: dihydrolipoamide acetyltransferase family protein [unclassified Brevibacterium]|uniref:dihydrolipoamide acetyltransferase family protein n=1 Tax=unclassified Brevibacterium TaxID=2614124 RepID=UPI001E347101|nr:MULTISPECIES: dihydrolipoamide acetyltransferase family protein [unclassified Brevibacterium]MCD1286253.1 branched-chain alpha-keto acid dehydrogenase subunit E2 [Brevibacterium sp. CCUG 69071]MDK8433613.1 dihydrolipoamide acetyltransferase family protein [Brevibacterium sp. H-BE7]
MSADLSTGADASGASAAGSPGAGTRDFILPDLGEGLTEAELISWKIAVGDEVHVDQMVVEVESAKSVVELPCPYAGRISALHAAAGDTVAAGQALLTVAEAASEGEASSEGGGANLIGYGTSEPKTRSSKKRSFGTRTDANSPTSAATPPAAGEAIAPAEAGAMATEARAATDEESRISPVTSPLVRKLANDHGISAKRLAGSGPGGIVTRADVLAAIDSTTASPATAAEPVPVENVPAGTPNGLVPAGTSAASARTTENSRDTRTPITGLRKVVSERLTRSRQEIPEATIWLDVDATELLNTKRALESKTGEKYSLLSLVARFVTAGLKKYPIINSSIDTVAGEIVTHGDINLGLAAQTPRGLMVPVVHGAGEMSLRQLRDSVSETVGKASTGKFSGEELSGGTFTLNNYGVFGVDGSAPIINLPEVAMLGLGRIKDRPWAVDGELRVRKVMYLSFVFDHRACDGEEPSQFLTFVADCIENPVSLLPEL